MSKALSLKLRDDIFKDIETLRKTESIPRNTYINQALEYFNAYKRKKELKEKFKIQCALNKEDALEVLHEFEQLEDNFFE